jgi:hypothetical protein
MTAPGTPARASRAMERGILTLFLAAAAVIGVGLAVPAIRHVLAVLSAETPVTLLTRAPVPHGAGSGGVSLVAATFDSASVLATGLSDAAKVLLALGAAADALTTILTAGSVALFFLLLMWRRPFHRALIVATQVAGAALLLGGVLSAGLAGLGRMMAADELNAIADDVFVVGFEFEPAWILAGLAVLALSFVFSYGTRLQRDTEGLV